MVQVQLQLVSANASQTWQDVSKGVLLLVLLLICLCWWLLDVEFLLIAGEKKTMGQHISLHVSYPMTLDLPIT